jgi:hypothetical protein
VPINVLLSFNFDYVFYSMHFRFHQVSKKALPLFELFSFAAIRREIEMMRKMEMAREIAPEGDGDGDGDKREDGDS